MAAGGDPLVQGRLDDAQILLHGLGTVQVHFFENVVVAAGNQDARLLHARGLDQFKVLFVGANPGGDLREAQAQVLAAAQGFLVLIGIKEELALPDHALGAAEAAHELEQVHDLFRGKGADGLLTVPEGGVGDPDLVGHILGHMPHIEGNLGDVLVVINLPVQVGLCHVLQGIFVFRLLDKVKPFVEFQHKKRPPFYFSLNVASLKRSPVHGAGGRERRYGAP